MSVSAFFPDGETAKQVLSRLGDSPVGPAIKAFAPSTRDGFHQKIVAWRGVRSGSTRVLLYLGSANMTGAGFWGLHQKAIAWNWEAGVLLEGKAPLWTLACRLARIGVRRWKRVRVPSRKTAGPEADEFGGDDDDLDAALRQDLATRVTAMRSTITLRSRGGRGWRGWTFREAWAIIDGRQRTLGRPIRLARAPNSIVVQGKYERSDQVSRRQVRLVDLDFPELCAGPTASAAYPALDALRAMLTSNSETAATPGSQRTSPEDVQPAADAGARADIRFPFGDFVGALASGSDRVAPWLAHVCSHPRVPGFWKHLARELEEDLRSELHR